MRWGTTGSWIPRPEGERPSTGRERWRAFRYALLDMPLTLRQDQSTEMAAGITFFLLFSLFPMLVCLVTFLPLLPDQMTNLELLFETVKPIMPPEVYALLHDHFNALVTKRQGGLALASGSIALFSASRAAVSLSRALNRTYRVDALKSEWLRRLRSMGLTMGVLLTFLFAVLGLTLGDWIVGLLISWEMLPVGQGTAIVVVRWPILFVLSTFLVQQLYFLLPDKRPRWRPMSIGSAVAVTAWVLSTFLMREFAASIMARNVAYGSLGSVAVVMAWLYLGSLALIVGATLNALYERGLPTSERSYGHQSADAKPGESDVD